MSIGFTPMRHAQNQDNELLIMDFINDAIVAYTHAVTVVAAKHLNRAMRAGLVGQGIYRFPDPLAYCKRKR